MSLNKGEILAQKALRSAPHARLRWPLLIAAMPFFGVVAAFGIAPNTVPTDIEIRRVVEELTLPVQAAVDAGENQLFWREERIRRGDTVATILGRLGVDDSEALTFLLQARGVRSLYQLIPGRAVRAVTTSDARLQRLSYLNASGKLLLVERRGDSFRATEGIPAVDARIMHSSGEITTSLFGATDAAGLHENIAIQIADIFSSDIDFHRDLRKGDRFSVVYEANYAHGEFAGVGKVLTAEFVNQNVTYRALHFQDEQGRGGYYTPDGKNVRKTFLRSPLEFSRVTSGFSNSRFHPILQSWRAHRGIDYGAPTGTRVRATADGTVTFAGWKGGYGKVVMMRHANGYSTLYGHLSEFADGIRSGKRIVQGQIVGYVGRTGLATGSHLHYEFLVNGVQRNPNKLILPPGPPITADLRQAFSEASRPLLARLDMMRNTNLATLD